MANQETQGFHPGHNPWAIALTVTLATFMEVMDTSIANVALPHIAGGLSAGQDESTCRPGSVSGSAGNASI
jgi:DHA2 family multidrug resistance protein